MMTVRIGVWTTIFLLIIANGCARSPQARRDKYLADGRALMGKKDYSRAILAFKNAAKAMPNDAESYYQLGIASLKAGDIRIGVISLRRAVELNPKHSQAKLKLAELFAFGDEPLVQKAESSLQELRQTTPVTPEMLNALAYSELRLGKPTDAVATLEEFLMKNPGELTSAILLARAKLAKNDLKGAEDVLKKASGASPKAATPHTVLGDLYRATSRPGDAEAQYRIALDLDPNNGDVLFSLAGAQYDAGRMSDVEATLRRLATINGPHDMTFGLLLLRQGRLDEAVREFERLAKQDPNDRMARSRLVSAYQMVGRTIDGDKVLEAALKKNPNDIDALAQRAQLLAASGKYNDAEKDLNKILQLQPNSALARYLIGKLDVVRGQELTSRQDFAKAVQLDPLLLSARLDFAQSLINGKDPKGALDVLDAAPESQRPLPAVIVQRNWALWALGDMAQMRKGVDAGLALQKSSDLWLQDGILKLRSGNISGGRASVEEALKVNPADVRALLALFESYEMQKQTALALEKAKEYAARQPRSAPVQNFLGGVLVAGGDRTGARRAFEAAKAAEPRSVEAELALADLDMLDGKLDDARGRLVALVSTNYANVPAHLKLGNLDLLKVDYQEAEKQFRAVLAAEPENLEALNNLAYLIAEKGGQPSEALKYAQKAKELAPDKPEYSDTLGWVLYRQGLYRSAVQELERATAKGGNPAWQYHLAMAYAKAGNGERAQSVLQRALKLDPKLPEATLARQIVGAEPSQK